METLASEYREFRNKLQVMDMMVAAGKEGEIIGRYIQEVARRLAAVIIRIIRIRLSATPFLGGSGPKKEEFQLLNKTIQYR